jgi:hypothetical protein
VAFAAEGVSGSSTSHQYRITCGDRKSPIAAHVPN